jgi:hypothetical protein
MIERRMIEQRKAERRMIESPDRTRDIARQTMTPILEN